MSDAVIYVRVSSDEQKKGMSPEFQEKDCRAYVEKKGMNVLRVFHELGESAKYADRPELQTMLRYCKENRRSIKAVVVWKLDRLSRIRDDYFFFRRQLKGHGIDILSATEPQLEEDSMMSKVYETFAALHAEMENVTRADRAVRGLHAKIASGICPWRPPLGYRRAAALPKGEKKLLPDEPDPILFPMIRNALLVYGRGGHTQVEIAKLLNEQGFPEVAGRKATHKFVHRLVYKHLDYYRGVLNVPWSGESFKGIHQAMLSHAEYCQILAARDGRTVGINVKKRRTNPRFPLRRTLLCADCGKYFTASLSRGKMGAKFGYYHCFTKGCPFYGKGIRKEIVEEAFVKLARKHRLRPNLEERIRPLLEKLFTENGGNTPERREALVNRLQAAMDKRRRVFEMREDGSYSKTEFTERKAVADREIASAEIDLAELDKQGLDLEASLEYIRQIRESCEKPWNELGDSGKQWFQKLLLPEGISWRRDQGFGTPKIGLVFELDRLFGAPKSHTAGSVGLDWNTVGVDLKKIIEEAKHFSLESESQEADPCLPS